MLQPLGTPSKKKKKKKCNKCYIGGGVARVKMLHFIKLCLKSISKLPQKWSSFLKKYIHCIFCYIRGGRGGQTRCNICYIFFFLKASLIASPQRTQQSLNFLESIPTIGDSSCAGLPYRKPTYSPCSPTAATMLLSAALTHSCR